MPLYSIQFSNKNAQVDADRVSQLIIIQDYTAYTYIHIRLSRSRKHRTARPFRIITNKLRTSLFRTRKWVKLFAREFLRKPAQLPSYTAYKNFPLRKSQSLVKFNETMGELLHEQVLFPLDNSITPARIHRDLIWKAGTLHFKFIRRDTSYNIDSPNACETFITCIY